MDLAFEIADRVTVLDHGEVVFEGPPAAARESPLVREIYLGRWRRDA
jgi:branched-chain amino acid transport system ATP-binding protein